VNPLWILALVDAARDVLAACITNHHNEKEIKVSPEEAIAQEAQRRARSLEREAQSLKSKTNGKTATDGKTTSNN